MSNDSQNSENDGTLTDRDTTVMDSQQLETGPSAVTKGTVLTNAFNPGVPLAWAAAAYDILFK